MASCLSCLPVSWVGGLPWGWGGWLDVCGDGPREEEGWRQKSIHASGAKAWAEGTTGARCRARCGARSGPVVWACGGGVA